MTSRDRLVAMAVAILAVLGGGWLFILSPESKKAASLQSEIATAATQLATAESQLAGARAAQARYSSEYATIVRLGKAVPPTREMPSLVYELAQASEDKHVDLSSITYGTTGTPGSTPSAPAAVSGFTQLPLSFGFSGGFGDLYNLFKALDALALRTPSGGLQVNGRLLTIQSVKLAPSSSEAGKTGSPLLSGTITATAYVLPASQTLTGGATAAAPSGASPASASSRGATAPTAPALARLAP
jgi:Tfp pilus assembly protein PilO